MKILIINWRALKDPRAGGAEKATYEHAVRWVKNHRDTVYWLSPRYKNGQINNEIIDGIECIYIRPLLPNNTLFLPMYYLVFMFNVFYNYMLHFRNKIDVIIEQHHGIPLLAPRYAKEKVLLYIHEVAGNIWHKMFNPPLSYLGHYLERFLLKLYKNNKIVTVSESTAKELATIGLKNVEIVNNGIDEVSKPYNVPVTKEPKLTLVYLNRLVKMKGIERTFSVVAKLKDRTENVQLWVLGKGEKEYVEQLQALAKQLNITDYVKFFGYVTEEEKDTLLRKAHILINPSYKEGWGLCNLEANSRGAPVVAFSVPGNIDSVKHGYSGLLSDDGDIDGMCNNIMTVMKDYSFYSKSSLEYAKQFTWENMSEKFHKLLESQTCT